MKRITAAIFVIAVSLMTVAFAVAQQSGPQHGATQPSEASAAKYATPQDHEAHHAQHMEMCRQMMSQPGMMGGGMVPMMGGDAKQQAEMMAMRGEMMKAMGDIMLKHAQRMRSGN